MKKLPELFATLMLSALAFNAQAFTFINGYRTTVKNNNLVFYVDIPGVSSSGISWNDAFDQASAQWSAVTPVQVSTIRSAVSPCASSADGIGGVGFSSDLCGRLPSYPEGTAAVALLEFSSPSVTITSDISFNPGLAMDVYDGTTRLDLSVLPKVVPIFDFRRISAHEVGHALGLGHSTFPRSILSSSPRQVFDKDKITADDICGVNIAHGNNEGCPLLLRNSLTVTGKPTSAVFAGGVSSDRGATYKDWFSRTDVIDVMATVVVEGAHVNQAGRLHVVAELSNGTTMVWGSRGFFPWDGTVDGLRSAANPQTLVGANEIYLLESFNLADNGISDVGVVFYLGYSLESDPSEIYYSGTPIQFRVE